MSMYTYPLLHPPSLTDTIHALDRGIVTRLTERQLHLPVLLIAGSSDRVVQRRRCRRCRRRRRQDFVTGFHPSVAHRHRSALRCVALLHSSRARDSMSLFSL